MSDLEGLEHEDLPRPGQRVGGRYVIARVLGSGATGVVYEAAHELTGKRVAIKWLRPDLASSESLTARFLREARAAAEIDHPNVVAVFDAGRERGTLFLVMELLSGEPLTAFLARGPHRVESVIATLMPALRGVAAAHERGIIHRDLKPDNVFLAAPRRGWPGGAKVLDFGISKLKQPVDGRELTHAGVFLGSPLYMAPEQILEPGKVDARGDVYSIGVMLYEGIAGRVPFEAETLPDLFRLVMHETPAPLRGVRPDVPAQLDALVRAALSRDRAMRPDSVATLARALEPFAGGVRFDPSEHDELDVAPLDGGRTEIVSAIEAPAPRPASDLDYSSEITTQPAISLAEIQTAIHAGSTLSSRTSAPPGPKPWLDRVPEPLRTLPMIVALALVVFLMGLLIGLVI
ncbi:serine/threonine-protein kinase [Sandaracinus amylolyticus]|uniref:serine/threonine-protein kinase n=1 Tax=Sandaracinus amylolyticus TaxID=927083 RepID=UPI001F19A7F1|nr:serine/threonine-protein kinase [Sandaracinus amylolyticus]UJR80606.1 Serine/threonine protein kinase PrkC, regulator of stationary phase [Sandaracinus amylolyticus]